MNNTMEDNNTDNPILIVSTGPIYFHKLLCILNTKKLIAYTINTMSNAIKHFTISNCAKSGKRKSMRIQYASKKETKTIHKSNRQSIISLCFTYSGLLNNFSIISAHSLILNHSSTNHAILKTIFTILCTFLHNLIPL